MLKSDDFFQSHKDSKDSTFLRSSGIRRESVFKSQPSSEKPLEALTDDELVAHATTLQVIIRRLASENGVFRKFLEKNNPEFRVSGLRLPHKQSILSSPPSSLYQAFDKDKISLNQKLNMVLRANEEMEAKVEAIRSNLKKFKFGLAAQLEDCEMKQQEILKATTDFEKYKQYCEEFTFQKFVHIMNEWSRKTHVSTDKFRLRYSSLRVQASKLSATLAYKRLIGENLNEIDVENLRIENLHLVEKIESHVYMLMELKQMAGKGNLQLSQIKQVLQKKASEKQSLGKAIKMVEQDIIKLDSNLDQGYVAMKVAKERYQKFQDLKNSFKAPGVLEYLNTKLELGRLKKEVEVWSKRKNLRDTTFKLLIQRMKMVLKYSPRYE